MREEYEVQYGEEKNMGEDIPTRRAGLLDVLPCSVEGGRNGSSVIGRAKTTVVLSLSCIVSSVRPVVVAQINATLVWLAFMALYH